MRKTPSHSNSSRLCWAEEDQIAAIRTEKVVESTPDEVLYSLRMFSRLEKYLEHCGH
jgi:hypothetical protein